MAEDKKTKSSSKQVFDVAKPGKTAASATSRPVIVGHGPMVQDQTVVQEDPKQAVKEVEMKPPSEKPDTKVVKPATLTKDKKDSEKEEAEKSKAQETDTADDNAVVDAVAEQAENSKKQDKESEEAAAKAEEVQKLVDEKKYFLPIKETRAKRSAHGLFMFLLIIVAVAVVANFLVDAEIIKTDIKPFTDIIQ